MYNYLAIFLLSIMLVSCSGDKGSDNGDSGAPGAPGDSAGDDAGAEGQSEKASPFRSLDGFGYFRYDRCGKFYNG